MSKWFRISENFPTIKGPFLVGRKTSESHFLIAYLNEWNSIVEKNGDVINLTFYHWWMPIEDVPGD